MLKKIAFLAVIVVGGLVLLNTRYGHVAWGKVKGSFEKQVSPEMRLEMIRDQVSKLDKDMRQNISVVAEQSVKVEGLREDIQVAEANLKTRFNEILTMKKDVESGTKVIYYGNQSFSVDRVKNKLARDWESYKQGEEAIKSQRKLLEAQERALTASRERLGALKTKKEQLTLAVEQLEADLKAVRLAQTKSDSGFDDSRVGEIQKEMKVVNDWIKTQLEMEKLASQYSPDPIPVSKKEVSATDVLQEINTHLKDADKGNEKVVEKE